MSLRLPVRRAAVAVGVAAVLGVLVLTGCTAARPATTPSRVAVASVVTPPVRYVAPPNTHRSAVRPGPQAARFIRHRANPCRHNSAPRFVRVSVPRQHLWFCARHHLVRDTAVTTGIVGQYTSTPTGRFTIQALERNQTLTLITGQQYRVHYWIPFQGPLFGFHDASWQTFPYGSRRYRTQGSHGCVHMPLRAIAFLYHWARVGTPVRITD